VLGAAAESATSPFSRQTSAPPVTAVCSTSKVELVRSLGADEVIDYTRENAGGEGEHVDAIIDTARPPLAGRLRRSLAREERSPIVGGEGGPTRARAAFERARGVWCSRSSRARSWRW